MDQRWRGYLAIALIITSALALSFLSSWIKGRRLPSEPEQAVVQAVRINPYVRLTRAGVMVKNQDSFAYPNPTLMINLRQWGEAHRAQANTIQPGQTVVVPWGEFVDGELRRFSFGSTKVFTVVVKTQVGADDSYRVLLFPDENAPGVPGPDKDP